MKVDDERYDLVIKAAEITKNEVRKRETPQRIRNKIVQKMNYNDRHFDRLFRTVTGMSLIEYVKSSAYEYAATKLQQDNRNILKRQTYEGIPNFRLNYERRKDRGDKVLLTEETLTNIKKLTESGAVEYCEIEEGKVYIEFNVEKILIYMLQSKTYVIPEKIIQGIGFKELPENAKRMALAILERTKENLGEAVIDIQLDELETECTMLESYDLDSPLIIEGMYIYRMTMSDNLKPVFKRIIFDLLETVTIMIPKGYEEISPFVEVKSLLEKCDEEKIEILWNLAKMGFLRIEEKTVGQ